MAQYVRMLVLAALGAACTVNARGQYSSPAFDLKKASELYDARGIENDRSLTVDGGLGISNVNGNVTYSYPISSTTVNGYPLMTTLNYCGSVSCTAYGDWFNGSSGSIYARWNRFHQNRPLWILGVNGFAIQALATASTYHSAQGRFPDTRNTFDDRDFVWMIDGYDVCNRMERIATTGGNETSYTDVIRLLRSDGSVLELVNHRQAIPNTPPDTRSDLFTGYYAVNEANSPAFGIVSFDSTCWPTYVRRHTTGIARTYPFVPRMLRYYPGDGMEYRFREWIIPYGTRAYNGDGLDRPDRFGGMWAGPTIFYLESIESASGTVTTFSRSRHLYPRESVMLRGGNIFDPVIDSTLDSTRGRALTTGFRGHVITYGDGAMVIEALGRTIRVRYDTVARSGDAAGSGPIPLATRGYLTTTAQALANIPETGTGGLASYGSWIAYVTEIVDPDGRRTRFQYQPYRRRYVNFGFPHANPPGNQDQAVSLANYRLLAVDEPTCRYEIGYAYGSPLLTGITPPSTPDTTIHAGAFPGEQPYWTSNVAGSVLKYDRLGQLLTSSTRECWYDLATGSFNRSDETVVDEIDGTVRSSSEFYRARIIDNGCPFAPEPRYTENYLSIQYGADTITTARSFDSIVSRSHLWLPVTEQISVNGVLRTDRRFTYQTGMTRDFGGDSLLARRYGYDVHRRIEQLRHPLTHAPIVIDSFEYFHLPLLDTTLVWHDSLLLKFASLDRYLALVRAGEPIGTWEESMYDPRVAVYDVVELPRHVWLPPVAALERRHVTADSNGVVIAGQSKAWSVGGGASLTDRLFRGKLVADSIVGSSGAGSRLKTSTIYSRLWDADRPFRNANANGATSRFYLESYSSPSLRAPDGSYRAVGSITRNDGTRVDTTLPHGGYLAELFEKPLAREDYVRRYTSSGQLRVDTLLTMLQYTFGGLPSIIVDPNRIVSRYAYDPSMRLTRAWLPYDTPTPMQGTTYTATRAIDLFGETRLTSYTDTLHCTLHDSAIVQGTAIAVARDGLYAATPVPLAAPPCPCHSSNNWKGGRDLAANCTAPIPFTTRRTYTGVLSFTVQPGSPLLEATSLSGAWLQLNVSATSGRCLPVRVRIPRLSVDRTYLLNCIEDGVAYLPDGMQVPDGGLLGVYSMRIDLGDALSQLRAVGAGEQVEITLDAPAIGTSAQFVGGLDAEDARPRLYLSGQFRMPNSDDDFTIAYSNDDTTQNSTVRAKIDDPRSSGNRTLSRRMAEAFNRFGADGRHLSSREASDSTVTRYSGLGAVLAEIDAEGDSVVYGRDADGREREVLHPDGTVDATNYATGLPSIFGIIDQDFLGFCRVKYERDERGVVTATYSDALDMVRRVVVDTAGLKLTTRMEYDPLGRITRIVSPGGDTTTYVYDAFGQVRAKSHPDLGIVSFAYDAVGNLRFSQTQEQANHKRLTYHEYDDLNRLVLVGEAEVDIDPGGDHPVGGAGKGDAGDLLAVDQLAGRLTELPATILRDGGASAVVTASKTLWMVPVNGVPRLASDTQLKIVECVIPPDPPSGELTGYSGPALVVPPPVIPQSPKPKATINDFEHHSRYPHFPRMAVSYDRLPERAGSIWGDFPTTAVWDSLAPCGRVRNLLQREAAVAWREDADQPYHYSVMSYDDRGRPEALLRRTEGLGYEAIYFAFNSMNQMTRMTIADPVNVVHSWIGYDSRGRVDSIWLRSDPGGGIARSGFANLRRPALAATRPDTALVAYTYTPDGKPATMTLPVPGCLVDWKYNARRWIDSIVATKGNQTLFAERLAFDPAGRVVTQRSEQAPGVLHNELYIYDNAGRLTDWGGGNSSNTTSYSYDADGNRTATWRPDPVDGTVQDVSTLAGPGPGSNRLSEVRSSTLGGLYRGITQFGSDPDGATTNMATADANGNPTSSTTLKYNYREIVTRATVTRGGTTETWEYRYAPNGERALKHKRATGVPGTPARLAWTILGLGRESIARWAGLEATQPMPNVPAGSRVMYPVDYSAGGTGAGVVAMVNPAGATTYRITDHLGSTRVTLDRLGSVVSRVNYDPFGSERVIAGVAPQLGFTGREKDRETSLLDMGVRKYSTETGRFMSVDPAWEMFRSLNPYQYSQLDPLRRIDPTGMWDIIVVASKDRANNPIANAYLVDRNGNVKFTFQVKVLGQHRNRMKTNGDTPFGSYDIDDVSPWQRGGSRVVFGPNPRLRLNAVRGEARASRRSLFRLHGGRQEVARRSTEGTDVRWEAIPGIHLSSLVPTLGCLRALDGVMRLIKATSDALEAASPEETPGYLHVVTPEEFERRFPSIANPK